MSTRVQKSGSLASCRGPRGRGERGVQSSFCAVPRLTLPGAGPCTVVPFGDGRRRGFSGWGGGRALSGTQERTPWLLLSLASPAYSWLVGWSLFLSSRSLLPPRPVENPVLTTPSFSFLQNLVLCKGYRALRGKS